LSTIRRATPLESNLSAVTTDPVAVGQGGLATLHRQVESTTLVMSPASWNFVLLDYGADLRAGVGRVKTPPIEYPADEKVIVKVSNSRVDIMLKKEDAFTFRLVSNNTSITVTLSAAV
jgi:hypothetical protein